MIPEQIKRALIQRNEARAALDQTERNLQCALSAHAGKIYTAEGVPFRVCGSPGALYWRRLCSAEEAATLRKAWRES